MEKKTDYFNILFNIFIDLIINILFSVRDLIPKILKSNTNRILFLLCTMIGIFPIIKLDIESKYWIIFLLNYFILAGFFRTFVHLRHNRINKKLTNLFNAKVKIINSIDIEIYIKRFEEIILNIKSTINEIKSLTYDGKIEMIKKSLLIIGENNILKSDKKPIKNYTLRSSIPLNKLSKKIAELSHILDTNIIGINQGASKKVIVLKTSKFSINENSKLEDKIQYYLNEFGFNVSSVKEISKDELKVYEIVTTSEFSKINKMCDHLAFRLGIDKKKSYLRERIGKIEFVISGESRIYNFNDYISLPSLKNKTKKMQVPALVGIELETGKLITVDMAKFPHALLMGGTGQGKSSLLNVLIQSSMYFRKNLAFLMFDFKRVELNQYKDFQNVHFINNYPDAIEAIDELNKEMNRRLDLFAEANVKDLESFNLKYEEIPYLIVVIDEGADIKLEAQNKATAEQVNTLLNQCINKARCTGIVVLYAMQRADSTQINCSIRDQLMTRIGFKTSSENQKQFVGIQNLTGLEKGEIRLKFEEDEKLIKCLFIDDRKLETNEVYNILKEERCINDKGKVIKFEKTFKTIENKEVEEGSGTKKISKN
jgi:uncharacterized membrane protein